MYPAYKEFLYEKNVCCAIQIYSAHSDLQRLQTIFSEVGKQRYINRKIRAYIYASISTDGI